MFFGKLKCAVFGSKAASAQSNDKFRFGSSSNLIDISNDGKHFQDLVDTGAAVSAINEAV